MGVCGHNTYIILIDLCLEDVPCLDVLFGSKFGTFNLMTLRLQQLGALAFLVWQAFQVVSYV